MLSEATASSKSSHFELFLQNKRQADLQEQKLDIGQGKAESSQWKVKMDEVPFKVAMVRQHNEVSATKSDHEMVAYIPQMKACIDAKNGVANEETG